MASNALRSLYSSIKPALLSSAGRQQQRTAIRCAIESPVSGLLVQDTIAVKGWAHCSEPGCLEPGGAKVSGSILINDRKVAELDFNSIRPDVQHALGIEASSAKIGFSQDLDWQQVCGDLNQAHLQIELASGGSTLALGPFEVRRFLPANVPQLMLQLETPSSGQTCAKEIRVSGWCASRVEVPIVGRVKLSVGQEERVYPLARLIERPDVAAAYGLDPKQSTCGFDFVVPWDDFHTDAEKAVFDLQVVHGAESVSVGPFAIHRASSPLLRHQRGSYKDVWNDASSQRGTAMAMVAGTENTEEFLNSGELTAATLKEVLQVASTDTVLEVGCGLGRIGRFLAPCCSKWIGSDISGKMLERADEFLKDVANVELIELTQHGLRQFDDASIDKLYCSAVLMHLDEWDRYGYITEAFRVLRPGGIAYFDNINLMGDHGWHIFSEIAQLDPAARPAAASKASTPDELLTYMARAGYAEIELRPGPHFMAVVGCKPPADSAPQRFKFVDYYPPAHVFKA